MEYDEHEHALKKTGTEDEDFLSGDNCFLFSSFDIDQSLFQKLPVELYPGIHIVQTPRFALSHAAHDTASEKEHVGLAAWVCPGYGLNISICNICIKVDRSISAHLQNRYFWLMVCALFLAKPLYIAVSGSFHYGNAEDGYLGRKPHRIELKSNICLNSFTSYAESLEYSEEDLQSARRYFPLLVNIFNSQKNTPRPFFNISAFLEAIFWERLHYSSTIFSKLFPLIDSFSGNPGHKHKQKISRRLGSFLSGIYSSPSSSLITSDELESRIQSIWGRRRPPNIHGFLDIPDFPSAENFNEAQPPIGSDAIADLFEISRSAIVKMLLLSKPSYEKYTQIPLPGKVGSGKTDLERDLMSDEFFNEEHKIKEPITTFATLKTHPNHLKNEKKALSSTV